MANDIKRMLPTFLTPGPNKAASAVDTKADEQNDYRIDQSGTYLINTKDGGRDEINIDSKKDIHAGIDTDKDDVVNLQGWQLKSDEKGVRTYTNDEDPNSYVAITGEGTVTTNAQEVMQEASKNDPAFRSNDPAFQSLGPSGAKGDSSAA